MRRLWPVFLVIISVLLVFYFFATFLNPRNSSHFLPKQAEGINPQAEIDDSKQYVLEIWDEAYPNQREGGKGEEFLQLIIKEFQKKYPNVTVTYKFLPFHRAREELQTALENGCPPDIFSGIVDDKMLASGLLVPIDGYLREDERSLYEEAALRAVEYKRKHYGWPRWLTLRPWVGDKIALFHAGINLEEVCTNGWTQQKFLDVIRKVTAEKSLKGGFGFIPYALGDELFDQLMLAKGAGPFLTDKGELGWSQTELKEAAVFISKLREIGVCPSQIFKGSRKMLEFLRQGKAGVCGPIGLWVYDLFEEDNNLVLLPIPTEKGEKLIPVEVTSLAVFRCMKHKGDDQVRLAMEFARFYSRGISSWVPVLMRAVPAYKPDQIKWGNVPWLQGTNRLVLLDSCAYKPYRTLSKVNNCKKEAEIREKVLLPNLEKLWRGEISPEKFAEKVAVGADMLLPRADGEKTSDR